jgi:tetratricopeptide (TPR) repeat protein
LGENDVAERHYRESLALWEAINDQSQIGALNTNLAICATDKDDVEGAYQLYQNSCSAFELAGNYRGLGSALMNLGFLGLKTHRNEEARDHLTKAEEYLRSSGHIQDAEYANASIAWIELDRGNPLEFKNRMNSAIESAVEMHDSTLLQAIAIESAKRSFSSSGCDEGKDIFREWIISNSRGHALQIEGDAELSNVIEWIKSENYAIKGSQAMLDFAGEVTRIVENIANVEARQ